MMAIVVVAVERGASCRDGAEGAVTTIATIVAAATRLRSSDATSDLTLSAAAHAALMTTLSPASDPTLLRARLTALNTLSRGLRSAAPPRG
jgi:hypothetical protein